MTGRDRLIEIVDKAKEEYANDITDHTETDYIVECLLNNGVIAPPCKVGDMVYVKGGKKRTVEKIEIQRVYNPERLFYIFTAYSNRTLSKGYVRFYDYEIGKTVFLTREEAEKGAGKE